MKLKIFLKIKLFIFVLFFTQIAEAQTYWVFFKDKCASAEDYFDLAVSQNYLTELESAGIPVISQSKWLNAVSVDARYLEQINQFPFVVASRKQSSFKHFEWAENEYFSYGHGNWQVELIRLDSLHRKGFTGKGITMAVFDGGFYNLDSIPAFDSLWINNQIKAHRDFANLTPLTFKESSHGMKVMSLLSAYYKDSLIGASPHANYVLARTEVTETETHTEEFNWINAMEWADSIGVDIIHSSLGYSEFDSLEGDYTYADMDGQSTIITLAAELAASRGIFITNSAGNQGDDPWHYITAPCDGAHVLCVGAVDSFRVKGNFSSFGPSADGRIKPEVMAMGVRNTVLSETGILQRGSGTSFSGPIMAGAVACLMQAHPSRSNEAIRQAIIMSCDKYTKPDSAYGYGIPDLVKADSLLSSFTSVQDRIKLETIIAPNPVVSQLQVSSIPGSDYSLFTFNGSLVMQGKLLNWINFIDLSTLPAGSYVLEVHKEHDVVRKKIIKTN